MRLSVCVGPRRIVPLLFLFAGCVPPLPVEQTAQSLGPPGACPADRWVAVASSGTCSAPQSWRSTPIGRLGRAALCLIEWNAGGDPEPSRIAALEADPALMDLGRDCPVVGGLGTTADEAAPHLVSAHDALLQLHRSVGSERVRLAVLDTMPPGANAPRARHGPWMNALALGLACPSGTHCDLDLHPELALPLDARGRVDTARGGYYGRPTDIASAIELAVDRWRADRDEVGPLVVSLSLGWDPVDHLADTLPEAHLHQLVRPTPGISGPVRRVHAAIVRARCEGALVVAASGNDPLLRQSPDPLLPGGWARLAAPSPAQCRCLDSKSPDCLELAEGPRPTSIGLDPLVQAASGLGLDDSPSLLARSHAAGLLAAPADHTPIRGVGGYDVISGSSVATVRVAATAALVWSHRPGWSAAELMEHIYRTGVDLGTPADLCPGGSCPSLHRIAPCDALNAAGVPARCPPAPPAHFPHYDEDLRSSLASTPYVQAVATAAQPTHDGSQATHVLGQSTCSAPVRSRNPSAAYLCPLDQLPAAQFFPAVAPQPEDPMCPACSYSAADQRLLVSLDALAAPPSGAILVLESPTGPKVYDLWSLVPGGMVPGESYVLENLPGTVPIEKARIEFTLQHGSSTTVHASPLIVAP